MSWKTVRPVSPRDHETIQLANVILDACSHRTHDVVLGALTMGLLQVLRNYQDTELPPDVQALAVALSDFQQTIRLIPNDGVQ